MEDEKIIDLYWARQENAIMETDKKYGNYCRSISLHILKNQEDTEECVNDTWLRAWDTMPPKRPDFLAAFLGKITRNLSISRYRMTHAQKRGSGEVDLLLMELEECLPSAKSVEEEIEGKETVAAINRFLYQIDEESRNIFVRRYFYVDSIKEIANRFDVSESKVKSQLFRIRNRLKDHLEKEGVVL
ncbi:MAG: sigma-70 family RNA polymerase sigma factor [Lachnospiraceae bacterium]|nr:sigma-70 family RNA polymerase sigma factor [Lachnospiraceae bacterium]